MRWLPSIYSCTVRAGERNTPYLPVPYILDDFPKELTEGSFCDAVFVRWEAKRELLDKLGATIDMHNRPERGLEITIDL